MDQWTIESLGNITIHFDQLTDFQKQYLLQYMNSRFPPSRYTDNCRRRQQAIENMMKARAVLDGARQEFPPFVNWDRIEASQYDLQGCAVVFTAGGEGERLRLSLLSQGVPADSLNDFTKATYPLKDFFEDFGALHANLAAVSHLSSETGLDIPVIITTGPEGSITSRIIPRVLERYDNFGLKKLLVIEQDERLHLSADLKMAYQIVDGNPLPVMQPDETGGPLMKLKRRGSGGATPIEWMRQNGCKKIIIVQATALYDMRLLPLMAAASTGHDCLAVGILRSSFPKEDLFGAQTLIVKGERQYLAILEQDVRNERTHELKDRDGRYFLPLNTGFYAVDTELLAGNDLPDYATPPKELLPGLPRSPKIGYAATDLLPPAKDPIILTVNHDMYGVIKTASDLSALTELANRFGLQEICKKVARKYRTY